MHWKREFDGLPWCVVSSARSKASQTIIIKEMHIVEQDFRVNEAIRVPEVRLIGPNGENVGVVPIRQAIQIAREAELDLVEVSPNATPPVCRVLDFGKFLYEREKKRA